MKRIIKYLLRIIGIEVSRYRKPPKNKHLPPDPKYLADTYANIADTLVKLGRYKDGAEMYKKAIGFQPASSSGYEIGHNLARQRELKDGFYQALLSVVEIPEIVSMVKVLLKSPVVYHPSKLWLYYMVFNTFQLETGGIGNFKRTINNNYFNWTGDWHVNPQFQALKKELHWSSADLVNAEMSAHFNIAAKPEGFTKEEWRKYIQFLCMLWEFTVSNDHLNLLSQLKEPVLGNPIAIEYKGRNVTQDICNSVLEVNTIMKFISRKPEEKLRIIELGAGYGRVGYALLHAVPNIQVVIVDIPPALYVSQWYLTGLFPGQRVFKFRDFSDYREVRQEFEESSIAFLSPAQIGCLPDRMFDLFINISSLHEMTLVQIDMWFGHIDRLCKGWFYTKQWIESVNIFDGITIRREDYPVKPHWKELLNRKNLIYPELFEAVYKVQ
ncbi:MAG: Uncharacterized protein FD189_755 [Elusimicrobia bacterium]|nr:MAG: Uncharacterized protein FD154_686 [Elusimicrobiota bacterium]KAF0157001.1 MAG: Uncharacterized protein FD189_755 [Elusimicrobiota bacterium]